MDYMIIINLTNIVKDMLISPAYETDRFHNDHIIILNGIYSQF